MLCHAGHGTRPVLNCFEIQWFYLVVRWVDVGTWIDPKLVTSIATMTS